MANASTGAQCIRRLPLEGTKNTRDLGGYPCKGGTTRWHMFLRSDNPSELTANDINYLKAYGVTDAVDLRRDDEAERQPSVLVGQNGFTVHSVPLGTDMENVDFEGANPGTMAGFYTDMLDRSGPGLADAMRIMAAAKGAVIFHCAVGKDRTGVLAMLLLDLAGVEDADIVADYSMTEIYMREIFDAQAAVFRNIEIPEYLLKSLPESMRHTIKHLKENYGTAEDYLLGQGLTQEEINTLKQKIAEPA